ncbi:hypothetical protein HQQ80_10690 [Microbacteriaceae bacterium VKM Ac-2855]|nr:hypothetical protein [Microbacteriaceae bacterium VKM Ac-2855]
MKARIAASIVLAVGVAMGTAGCNLIAPQATTKQYDPSDGVGTNVGDIAVRNAMIISDDGELGNLVVTVVNSGTEDIDLQLQYESADGLADASLTASPGTTVIGEAGDETVHLDDLGTVAGSLVKMYFAYGSEETAEALVPVLTSDMISYSTLAPTATPTPTVTPTVTPTSTLVPTPEATTAG